MSLLRLVKKVDVKISNYGRSSLRIEFRLFKGHVSCFFPSWFRDEKRFELHFHLDIIE